MAIKNYTENGESLYRVRIVRKSQSRPGVQVERKEFGYKSLPEAQKAERRLYLEAERELVSREERGLIWKYLVEDWNQAVRDRDIFTREVATATTDDYLAVLKKYASTLDNLHVEEIDKARVWRLLDQVERDVSFHRRKRLRAAIDSIFKWGILSGRIKKVTTIPTEGYKALTKEEEKLPEILNLTEIRQLLKHAKQMEHPWYPIWTVALFTGMRSGELFALEWSKLDFDNKLIYVYQNWTNKDGFGPTKGRYWRVLPMGPELITLLKELKLQTGSGKFVLPHFHDWAQGRQAHILRAFCVGCAIPSVRFHTLRACFATQLIRDGVAPAIVMKVGGWKDLKTMQRYIRLAGIEIQGATDGLKFLPEQAAMGRVIELFNN